MEKYLIYAILLISLITLIIVIISLFKNKKEKDMTRLENELYNAERNISAHVTTSLTSTNEVLTKNLTYSNQTNEERFRTFEDNNRQQLNDIRNTIEKKLSEIQKDNITRLDQMKETVDQKLQKTIQEKMDESLKNVVENLQTIYTQIGEMKQLSAEVGDLKSVLSNVKTRGILGEIQLKAILQEILTKEQYEENVETVPNSNKRVEFAIKLPGDNHPVYLPIDSKFPGDTYQNLLDAYNTNDKNQVDAAFKELEKRIKQEAKDIHDKYIQVPYTTDFAIMFLPFEGLYSEVVNRNITEILQRDYHVNVAGPSTMAALLNSLQMGFKTLAIEKRSAEVWEILGRVKSEFSTFNEALKDTQKKIQDADKQLESLVVTRTKQMLKKLEDVHNIENDDYSQIEKHE